MEQQDFFDGVRDFNLLAGNTVDRFNVRQSALYTGMQLEELGEKMARLGLTSLGNSLKNHGMMFKRGELDHTLTNCNAAEREGLLDDDVDLLVVTVGSMLSMGVDVKGACAEVNRANDDKVWYDGKLHKDANGKIVKPEGWTPPDLSPFVCKV